LGTEPLNMGPLKTGGYNLKIGIALGGGAAYGIAHTGVLKVLEKNGIVPDFIAGTSVGAIIGGLYASGCTIAEVEAACRDFDWLNVVKFTIPKEGLISFERLDEFINKHAKVKNIEDTKIKFASIGTNLLDGKVEALDRGPLAIAIRASCGLPGIFSPTDYKNKLFVDGGVLNNVPTDIVKQMGADFVIGVDVLAKSELNILKHRDIFSVVWKSWQLAIQRYILATSYKDADAVIMPDISEIHPFDISKREIIMKKGEEIAEQEIGHILELIRKDQTFVGKIKNIFKQ
jgi:NTE family protein